MGRARRPAAREWLGLVRRGPNPTRAASASPVTVFRFDLRSPPRSAAGRRVLPRELVAVHLRSPPSSRQPPPPRNRSILASAEPPNLRRRSPEVTSGAPARPIPVCRAKTRSPYGTVIGPDEAPELTACPRSRTAEGSREPWKSENRRAQGSGIHFDCPRSVSARQREILSATDLGSAEALGSPRTTDLGRHDAPGSPGTSDPGPASLIRATVLEPRFRFGAGGLEPNDTRSMPSRRVERRARGGPSPTLLASFSSHEDERLRAYRLVFRTRSPLSNCVRRSCSPEAMARSDIDRRMRTCVQDVERDA